jgi:Uma2 family endonuclease
LPSLKQYLIVHQKRYCIEVYQKNEEGQWGITMLGKNDMVIFDCLESKPQISVQALYDGVEITPVLKDEEAD